MTKRKNPICVRPDCTRAVTHSKDYDGLCFHHAKAAGIAHHLVPWHKVHAELERLINGGWTCNAIEEDHLVFNTTLRDIKFHRRDRFKHTTYQALKEIPTLSPYRRPAWPLRRRVNALRAIGITFAEIGEEIGEKPERVQHLSYDRARWAPICLDEKIRAYYTQHANDPVREIDGKTKKLNLARPYDWDNIDNPHEHARASIRTSGDANKRQPVTPELLSKLDVLVAHYGTNKAASAIGINAKTITRIRQGKSQCTNEKTARRIENGYDKLHIRGGQAA
ncbi:Uncharacterised protein [Corynebacterium striatum]|uniref:Uncharacterized protein n=1 Tax=Corynebacterium striatum TaxID=43770 RepID=A0AAQ1TX95_CORST|nr:hypothetical protein [Corynebacterium striatum]EEI77665.1 hypothetical protein HMPREF0308_2041 [Corynebacterium striatum ATCC 6940]QQE52073.1 hypothetical protein I6I11_07840 [Corynebacterium striatum]GEA42109.1 hypothetical protein Cst04h_02790 [Corynebacterium striatum]STD63131.1 Uncharacterised protein [Corynebacterium striatum]